MKIWGTKENSPICLGNTWSCESISQHRDRAGPRSWWMSGSSETRDCASKAQATLLRLRSDLWVILLDVVWVWRGERGVRHKDLLVLNHVHKLRLQEVPVETRGCGVKEHSQLCFLTLMLLYIMLHMRFYSVCMQINVTMEQLSLGANFTEKRLNSGIGTKVTQYVTDEYIKPLKCDARDWCHFEPLQDGKYEKSTVWVITILCTLL